MGDAEKIMDDKYLDAVCKQIFKRFPEVTGNRPKVQVQNSPQTVGEEQLQYLLIFQGHRTTADGKVINRIVRVVVSEKGKILKVSTSR
jgi:hypothetical protein